MFEFLKRPSDTYSGVADTPGEYRVPVQDNDVPHGEDV